MFGLLAVVLHRILHGIWDSNVHYRHADHTHEIGQLLGLAPHDSVTPIGIYRPAVSWLPDWLEPIACRFLHLEAWICAMVALLPVLLIASLALDWALMAGGDDADDEDNYL